MEQADPERVGQLAGTDSSLLEFAHSLVDVVVSEGTPENLRFKKIRSEWRDGANATSDKAATTTPCSASFVATSNGSALRATTVEGAGQSLGAILESNKAFKKAFNDDSWGRNSKPPDAPRPTIIQSSAHGRQEVQAHAADWGFVSTIVQAYNRHHELVLRPDDVWQAILTQFSFYVNANAEELRDRFVDFEGKKQLVVNMGGSLFTADYATFARIMVDDNITKNIKDPSVTNWLLPAFSTTTEADRVAASVSVMSTLQAYFEYVCCLCCGIPKVTLQGSPEDWMQLRAKIDRLPDYDLKAGHLTAWHQLLAPVLDEFVSSALGSPNLEFWDRVCSRHGGGSGPSYLSGWVTVFAAFTDKGVWQGDPDWRRDEGSATPDQMQWPYIDMDRLPVGVLVVPVLVDDNGIQYDTQMFAGQFAFEAIGDDRTGIRPRTDWCIAYEGIPRAEPKAYTQGGYA